MHRALTVYACGFTGVVKVKNLPVNDGVIAIPWATVLFSQCCLTWQARFKMPGAQGLPSVTQVPLKSKSLTRKNKARIHSRLKNKCIAVTIKPHIGFQLCSFLDPVALDASRPHLLSYPRLQK